MRDWQRRVVYLICAFTVVALGLGSRRFGGYLPGVVAEYAGDTLWALGVFLGLGCLAPHTRTVRRAIVALAVSYGVEVSQLYHAPWIDALRHTTLGALILGFGFLWSDRPATRPGLRWVPWSTTLLVSMSARVSGLPDKRIIQVCIIHVRRLHEV